MERNNIKGSLILTLGALIWGLAFVVQSDASSIIKPFAFNSMRSLLGSFVIGIFLLIGKLKTKKDVFEKSKESFKNTAVAGVVCGIFLALSINLQQTGLSIYPKDAAPEARAGFITALYVILVPIVSIFFKKRISPAVWIAVLVAFGGIYLLCLTDGISGLYFGDVLMFFCAVACTFHILSVDKFVSLVGGPQLSMIQFLVCGIISGILSLIFEPDMALSNIYSALPQILYMGIMSSGVAYTLQIVGQKYAEPAVASISMSLESVFAALGGWIIMGNSLSIKEFFGCALVFIAIITAQIPEIITKKVKTN